MLLVAVPPGPAALVAPLFTRREVRVAEQGQVAPDLRRPPTAVAAVVNVLAHCSSHRSSRHDGDTQVDRSRADLRGLVLTARPFKDLVKLPEDGAFPRARAPRPVPLRVPRSR